MTILESIHTIPAFDRIVGDEAVLTRLERLGRHPRTLPNLAAAGIPARQLDAARIWYAESANNPVSQYAARTMARGFFEDESLLQIFCRYFDCTDWRLENSPWFYAPDDYSRFTRALVEPVAFHTARLKEARDLLRLLPFVLELPPDLAIEHARTQLWEDLRHRDYFWKPLSTYAHLRAENLFGYLSRTLDLPRFQADRFNYHWEEAFRREFGSALHAFDQAVHQAVHLWREAQREAQENQYASRNARQRRRMVPPPLRPSMPLVEAFALLDLEPETASYDALSRAYRKCSLSAHPDRGGSPEAFRRLSEARELIEAWLRKG